MSFEIQAPHTPEVLNSDASWFVTGITGFVGSHLFSHLASLPGGIYVGTRRPEEMSVSGRAVATPLDLLTQSNVVIPAGVGTVIHLAGEKRDVSRMWAINYEGTRRLLEASARAGVRRFIYLSSVGVYGAPKHAGVVDERHPRTPRNIYEASKNAGEACVRELCVRWGIEHVIVQPTNVIGYVPGQSYPLLGLMSMIKAGRFAYFGKREAWVNYVGVDDVAAVIAAACRRGRDGAIYIVNTPTLLSDLVKWVCDELGVRPIARRLPAWVGEAAAAAGNFLEHATGHGVPLNAERFLELTNTTRYDGEAATRALELAYPIGIETTVRKLVQAYRAEGRL